MIDHGIFPASGILRLKSLRVAQPELQSENNGCNLELILFMTLLWEHRHSIIYSIRGKWYCFPFLTSTAYRIWFKSTHWWKLYQLDLFNPYVVKIKESPKQSIHYFSSVYRFFSVFYLDCHSYSVYSKTYQWIIVHGVATGGPCYSDHFPMESSASPCSALVLEVYFWRWPPLRRSFWRAFQEPEMLPLERFPEGNWTTIFWSAGNSLPGVCHVSRHILMCFSLQ